MNTPGDIRIDPERCRDRWQFWIDVGGTFTDCIGCDPSGRMHTAKVLSSGRVNGRAESSALGRFVDPSLKGFGDRFFERFSLSPRSEGEQSTKPIIVRSYDSSTGEFEIEGDEGDESSPAPPLSAGQSFELFSGEPAPLLAIRRVLRLRLDDPIPAIEVRLGATRGTNALLERKGARTAWITTEGFGDVLRIANQDRPDIFALDIRKPTALYDATIEIGERVTAQGEIERPLDVEEVESKLKALRRDGIEALAVCLLNAYKNPEHERIIQRLAEPHGFRQVSISSTVASTIKIVSRGDTTVVDAYLSPVIQDYVRSIAERIPEGRLKLMTSAGGLVDVAALLGKDTILSGPAGGVVGFSRVARAAGFNRAIGFDMGGTSTDVSRHDGEFVYEYETKKAGVRIVAPMLAIETVAAGGGSICGFDGQKLIVGPESAGANPGPACYGKGGPLAVTDINLALGRIQPDYFPFELNREAVSARLDELAARVREATGQELSHVELAEGFRRIANANMAAAIKKISVAKGYDVREYALVSFGGAAAQHACAIARELGISTILIHPFAGILSAYGMGLADVKKFDVATVLSEYSSEQLEKLEPRFEEMEARLRDEVEAEGIAPNRIGRARRELELRYRAQSSAISIARPEDGDYAQAFEQEHRRLYGHVFENRPIEIVTMRAEVTGETDKPQLAALPIRDDEPAAEHRVKIVFEGDPVKTDVFRRAQLSPGRTIIGPALIIEATSTTVLDPGWTCRVSERGDLILRDEQVAREHENIEARGEADPIMLEIFNNQFAAIAEQMGVTLRRTSLSVNVKERLDFSCALFTPEGDLVVNAPHMPVHLGAMGECVKCVIEDVADLAPGDVIVTNNPFRGGSHLPDVTVLTPVFEKSKSEILFFVASRAHHAEIGGIRPGSMPPDSTNLAEEGVLIRHVKAVDRGEPKLDALRHLLRNSPYPSRAPEENIADIHAQIAANQAGVNQLLAMIARYGKETTHAYMRHIQSAAERKMRFALSRLEDGDYTFKDEMDEGSVIKTRITIKGDRASVDFAGTSPVMAGNMNANTAIVKAAVIYCFRMLIDEPIPLNAGVLAPVEVIVPECLLNPPSADDPRDCPAVVGGNVETSQRIVDVILGALNLAAASQGTMNNLTFGDDRFGYYETICGGAGAGPDFDGADAVHTHMTNTRLTDPEVLEARYPVRVRRFEIRRGSGGAGRRRGGDGARREIEFLEPLEVSILSNRRTTRPFGLKGGEPGAAGVNRIVRKGESAAQDIGGIVSFKAEAGDRLTIETPGGGGYGKPS